MVEGIVCGNEKTSGKELRTNSPLCVSACSLGNPSDHAFALNQTVSPFSSAIWYNSRYQLMRLKLMLLSWTQGARIVVRARLESSSSIVGKSTTCTVPLCKCGHRSTGVHSVRSSFFVNPSFKSRSHPRLRKSLSDCDAGVVCRCGMQVWYAGVVLCHLSISLLLVINWLQPPFCSGRLRASFVSGVS